MDIVSEIAAEIPVNKVGSQPWYRRVPQEHVETVRAIHDAWKAGVFGVRKITAARVIAAKLQSLGIQIGEQGVIHWLKMPTY